MQQAQPGPGAPRSGLCQAAGDSEDGLHPAPSLKHHPPMPATLSLSGALGHAHADKRIDILRQIGVCGSISQAARAVGVSYKAAWQALGTLTHLAGRPPGGAGRGGGGGGGGGGVRGGGREWLAAADALALARGAVLARWQAAPDAGPALARLALRTSMRNQLPCTLWPVALQGQIVRVPLRLARTDGAGGADGALDLAARITRESAELLGLQPGLAVQALCKATAVRVERAGAALAAEPGILRLPAKAVRVVRGSSGDEVSAELAAGLQLVGFAMPGSGLRAGHRVVLVLEENAVVLALAHG